MLKWETIWKVYYNGAVLLEENSILLKGEHAVTGSAQPRFDFRIVLLMSLPRGARYTSYGDEWCLLIRLPILPAKLECLKVAAILVMAGECPDSIPGKPHLLSCCVCSLIEG